MKRFDTDSDKGAVLIVVVGFVVVAMILLAFVVDRGRLYIVRSQMQSAVDAAALAGAQTFCGGTGDAKTVAVSYGAQNGVTIDPNKITVITGTTSFITVRASQTVDLAFGAFADTPRVAIGSLATAEKNCSVGYAAFAGGGHQGDDGEEDEGQSSKNGGLQISGPTNIQGSVYSDGDMKITSNQTIINGVIDYVNSCTGCSKAQLSSGGATTPWNGSATYLSTYCYAYQIGLDRPAGRTCPGGALTGGLIQSMPTSGSTYMAGNSISDCDVDSGWLSSHANVVSLNCGSRDVHISASWTNSTKLALISTTGSIIIDSDVTVGNSSFPVILYSMAGLQEHGNAGPAIDISGSSSLVMYGYLYAPIGRVYSGGSNNIVWTGTIIADGIDFNGATGKKYDGSDEDHENGGGGGVVGNVGFLARQSAITLVQ